MNRKLFIAICAGVVSMAASAHIVISPTGEMDEVAFQAVSMSPDGASYACGINTVSGKAAIWDIKNDTIAEYGDENEEVSTGGAFYAVNNSGLAVGEYGEDGNVYPAKMQFGSDQIVPLYCDSTKESGGGAWAVSSDGQIVLGFYTDIVGTHACIWRNGGLHARDRINLPAPTKEEFGSMVDNMYEARWMSNDASVVLGLAQDGYNGEWVMIYWTLELEGYYKVHCEHAKQYFTPFDYNELGDAYYVKPNCPYSHFEPNAISANGEWVSLTVAPKVDLSDDMAIPVNKAARLNLVTKVLEVLDLGEYDAPVMYGIADNGTCAGATGAGGGFGPMAPARGASLSNSRNGYVWFAGSDTIYSLQDMYPTEPYFNYTLGDATISTISSTGTKILGFTNQVNGEDFVMSSYIATLPTMAVEQVEDAVKGVKMMENGHVVIIREGVKYNLMGQRL